MMLKHPFVMRWSTGSQTEPVENQDEIACSILTIKFILI